MARNRLGKYRLLRHLATGGMGEVFVAQQEGPARFSKVVVVKRLLRHLSSDRAVVDMFHNEARLAALVSHPNVVQIFDLAEDHGTHFIAMEYVRGRSLREVMRAANERGLRVPIALAVHVVTQILRGLEAAHALVDKDGRPLGLVHRDVTPENVLVAFDGPVKLGDFGIAKAQSLTAAGRTVLRGKYAYMAPEQYRNESLDARTDVYASGVVLYELLSGRRPFDAPNEAAVMHAILTAEPAPLLELALGVSPGLSAAVDRALSKDPADRFPSAEAMAVELEACLAESEMSASTPALRAFMRELFGDVADEIAAESGKTVAVTEVLDTPRRARGRAPLVAAAAALIALTGLGALLHARRKDASDPPRAGALTPSAEPPSPGDSPSAPAPPSSAALAEVSAPASSSGAVSPLAPDRAAPSGDPRARREHKPAARPSATARVAGSGMLSVRVRPWAEIFVDGRSVGVSPVPPIELPAGRHVIVLVNPELRAERRVLADVTPGATATVRADLFE